MRFEPGAQVELREMQCGRTWEVRSGVVVRDDPDVVAVYTAAGSAARIAAGPDGARLRLPPESWEMADVEVPADRSFLAVHPVGADHSTILIRDAGWRLLCWYINLESALKRTPTGFEYTDHYLDVVVAPDMSGWHWKDEDELGEAVERGLVSAADAERFRHEGERAVERLLARRPPYDVEWEAWRADPDR